MGPRASLTPYPASTHPSPPILTDTSITHPLQVGQGATTTAVHHEEYTRRGEQRLLCDAHDASRRRAYSRAIDGSFQLRLGRADRREVQQQAVSAHTRAHTTMSDGEQDGRVPGAGARLRDKPLPPGRRLEHRRAMGHAPQHQSSPFESIDGSVGWTAECFSLCNLQRVGRLTSRLDSRTAPEPGRAALKRDLRADERPTIA